MVIKPDKPDITGSLRELQRILSQRENAPQPRPLTPVRSHRPPMVKLIIKLVAAGRARAARGVAGARRTRFQLLLRYRDWVVETTLAFAVIGLVVAVIALFTTVSSCCAACGDLPSANAAGRCRKAGATPRRGAS